MYIDGPVTKDQSGWGFTLRQSATTVHKGRTAHEVSTTNLTVEMEAVTHAVCRIVLRRDSQTMHAIILTETVKNWNGKPSQYVSV